MTADRIPMSKDGYENLKAKLDKMVNEEMPEIAEAIAQARGEGDLSENAEYDAQREKQGMLQARINELQDKLARAFIVDRSTLPTDRVVIYTKVRVLDLTFDDEEDYILVGLGEEDYDQNKILTTGPIGQALLGKKVNDEVEVPIPRGTRRLRILEIAAS
jgi:transcription elongation factor GreA